MRGWKARVRELVAVTGALAVTLALIVWGASSASAGGPTSVLLVSPESAETASLYNSDKDYQELQHLLGDPGSGSPAKPPQAGLETSRQINVTWLLHDVKPWRVERVYPAYDDLDVWIHTSKDMAGSLQGHWHRAQQPTQLRALLKKLGLMGKASPEGASGIFPTEEDQAASDGSATGTDEPVAPEAAASKAPARQAAVAADGTDWWWALPGAAAGAVLALVLRPFASRIPASLRRRQTEPRQQLLDV
jgi:hypothetical protein